MTESTDTILEGEELAETGIKKRSRWVKESGVPRYDKKTSDALHDQYAEGKGWRHGAKIGETNG